MKFVGYEHRLPVMWAIWVAYGFRYGYPPCCIASYITHMSNLRPGQHVERDPQLIHVTDKNRVRRACGRCYRRFAA